MVFGVSTCPYWVFFLWGDDLFLGSGPPVDMVTTNVSVSIGIVPRVDSLEGRDVYVPKYISFRENYPENFAALVQITYMHTKALMETYSYNEEELRMLNVHVPSKSYMCVHAGTTQARLIQEEE